MARNEDINNQETVLAQVWQLRSFLWEFVNAVRSSPDKSLKDFYSDWCKHMGMEESYNVFSQGVYITMLYGMIVYPKEAFFKQIPDNIPFNNDAWGNPTIEEWTDSSKRKDVKNLTTRLRNSLNHNKMRIESSKEGYSFIFEDVNIRKNNDRVKIRFSSREKLDRYMHSLAIGMIKKEWQLQ